MQIKKRSLPMYIFLNCLTLGIYGFVVNMQIGDEINAICQDDGDEPKYNYAGAVMFRGIAPLIGLIIGLIVALVGEDKISYLDYFDLFGMGNLKVAYVFLVMAVCGLVFGFIGSVVSGIYHKYWWYRQANRLRLNAYRYNLDVKETGTDNLIFRTVGELLVIPITAILFALSIAIPAFIIWLITTGKSEGAYVFASILVFLCSLPIMFFGMELTAGANFSMFFIFKNLERFADVVSNGAAPFDKMAYRYYPSNESMIGVTWLPISASKEEDEEEYPDTTPVLKGYLYGLNGSCAGYNFELTPNEEFVVGKDASVASIVIDPSYKEISRKHCGITYNSNVDGFTVIDYSSNGTWANDMKLNRGEAAYFPKGTVLKLANDKNTFRLE